MYGYIRTPVIISIYKIECLENGRVYIGKTADYEHRIKTHFSLLRHHKHPIASMQMDFDRYGEGAFRCSVIDRVERYPIINGLFTDAARERELMLFHKTYLPQFGYNCKDHYFYYTRNGVTRCLVAERG